MTMPTISSLKGTGYKQLNFPTLSPEQQQLFSTLMGGSMEGIPGGLSQLSQLASGGTPDFWKKLESPAIRQFGQLQGNLASRFSGMGSGARRSSGFQNVLGGQASQLSEQLQANRSDMQQQAIQQLLGLGSQLLGTPLTETQLLPKKRPWYQDLALGLAPGLSSGMGMFGGLGMGKLFGF